MRKRIVTGRQAAARRATDKAKHLEIPVRRLPVARFNKMVNLTLTRLLKVAESDLSREQEVILRQLRARNGINQVALSELVNQDRDNISRTLSLLEAHGFIQRVVDPSDRRSRSVKITEVGLDAHEKAFVAIETYWKIAFEGFTDEEIDMFSALMHRMTENLEKYLKGKIQ